MIAPEHPEETGEAGEEGHREEMLPESKIPEPKEGYKVHASPVGIKDTSLAIAP